MCYAQAEEAEGKQDWTNAERLYAEATFIDTAATLINTALWLGLCRTRWHLQLSEASVEACDQTLSLQPDNVEAVKYKVNQGVNGHSRHDQCACMSLGFVAGWLVLQLQGVC